MNRAAAMIVALGAFFMGTTLYAQPQPGPLIGFLGARSAQVDAHLLAAFYQGLGDAGYVDGRNVRIAYRWADGQQHELPALAGELVQLRPAVLVAVGGNASALAAKQAAKTIPIVFGIGGDPVELGIVSSLSHPGGNATGMTMFSADLDAKRIELLREIAPRARVLAAIINPSNPIASSQMRQAQAAVKAFGQELHIFHAQTEAGIEEAFRAISQLHADALTVASDGFLIGRRARIIALANELHTPAIFAVREFADAGGLVSYGTHFADIYRQIGVYTGRVLNGDSPAALPIQRPTRFELVINLKTARALGLELPSSVLARADEVIE